MLKLLLYVCFSINNLIIVMCNLLYQFGITSLCLVIYGFIFAPDHWFKGCVSIIF